MSKKVISLVLGFTLGALISALAVWLLSPTTGKELRVQIKDHYKDARQAAEAAGEKRRAELEAELQQMRQGSR